MIRDILDVATPSMRPRWRPQLILSDREIAILMLAVENDPLPYGPVVDLCGGEPWSILDRLKQEGFLAHPGYNRWQITERGRVMLAITLAKGNRT